MINNLKKTLATEWIKKKRSGLFTLAVIFGIAMPALFFVAMCIDSMFDTPVKATHFFTIWFTEPLDPFAKFFLPLLIIISASKIAQIDHKNNGWRLMETQPVYKASIYFSKFLMLMAAGLISILVFTLATLAFGELLTQISTVDESYLMSIEWGFMAQACLRVFIASLAIIALQYALAVIIPSFIWSLIIGFVLLMTRLIAEPFNIDLRWYPFDFLFTTSDNIEGSALNHFFLPAEWLSLIYTAGFLLLGYHWYRFKNFVSAFAKARTSTITTLALSLGCILMAYLIIKPSVLEPGDKTIITGVVNSDQEVNEVYLQSLFTGDTLQRFPVTNGIFNGSIKQELPADYYRLQFDRFNGKVVYMSAGDSLYVEENLYGSKAVVDITGTRIAENLGSNESQFSFSWVNNALRNNTKIEDPSYYMNLIVEDYEDALDEMGDFITVDHIKAREDFKQRKIKDVAVTYRGYWNDYLKKKNVFAPDVEFELTEDLRELLATIELNDPTMLSSQQYVQMMQEELALKNKEAVTNGTPVIDLIAQQPDDKFKDQMMFIKLSQYLSDEKKRDDRDSVFAKYIDAITDNKLKGRLNNYRKNLNRLSNGVDAIEVAMIDVKGSPVKLSDYQGKYVVIDVWASWCGPCKQEEPYYIKKQQKYKKENIVFTSINVDKKPADWKEDVEFMSKNIKQLRPTDVNGFMKSYGIESIPRFMLIAPDGTIDNVNFTRPSSNSFDELLDNKLGIASN
ncbi:MAG: ABC transporter permease [Nonlabens sp.]